MSNQLSKPQLLQAVTCILGMEESDAGLTRLAEELTIGLTPWTGDFPEFGICRQDLLWVLSILVAAGGAGFRSIAQINNSDPLSLCVIEGWQVAGGGAAYMMARTGTLATTDGGNVAIARDGRWPRAAVPNVNARSQNGVALPAGFSNGQFIGDVPLTQNLSFPIVLGGRVPDTVAWYPSADNVSIRLNVWGRTRRVVNARELSGF